MSDWLLYADTVSRTGEELKIDIERANRAVISGAVAGVLFTRGRPHHEQAEPIRLEPHAWRGMDPYRALSMLCTPNPGDRAQAAFVNAPMLHKVEFHVPTLDAWLSQQSTTSHSDVKPGPKPGGESSVKNRVDSAVRKLVADGRIDPTKRGASAEAVRLIQSSFKGYEPATLERYVRPAMNELKKKSGLISRK
jgi:hypothetical protein